MGMRIDDEVYVHGYLDEIRQDKVIIRNEGGYFGTVIGELVEAIPKADYEARLKADLVAILTEIQTEIEETAVNITYQENKDRKGTWGLRKASEIIDKYKEKEIEEW